MSNTLEGAVRLGEYAGNQGKTRKRGNPRNSGLQREPAQKTNSFIK
ncbi:hypothetical protein [Paraburkholderia panacisoli]|nr:hypothetical protein [Paraburkholderia panacisoli]